jgi:hypothetical protein
MALFRINDERAPQVAAQQMKRREAAVRTYHYLSVPAQWTQELSDALLALRKASSAEPIKALAAPRPKAVAVAS